MNGACQDEDWLKISSIQLYRCRCYFESAFCTQFFMKMTHLNIEKKFNFSSTATFSYAVSDQNIVES